MQTIIISIFAGVIGTGIGGLLTAFLGSRTDKMTCFFLSFAGGVMVSIVTFELVPEAIELSNIQTTIIGIVIGVIAVLILNKFLDTASLLMFFAIALHNIPEGLAIGTAGYHDAALGSTLALMIAIHNIPEGMAISAPLISSGFSKWKTVAFAALAGAPTILGAFAGIIIGSVSESAIALSFSIAGGAMLYVVFGEILPESMSTRKDSVPTIIMLFGIIFGLLLTKI